MANSSSRQQDGFWRRAEPMTMGAGLLLALCIYGFNLWFGNLNQDEGWYLYAALERSEGRLPYRDFFFTQGPVLPWVYGWLAPVWAGFGLVGGRALTAVLGLAGGGLSAALAAAVSPRATRRLAALTAFLLTSGNLYHSYFTTIPKTYALGALFLLGGMLLLTRLRTGTGRWLAAPSGLLLALAAGTRLSLGLALPVTGLALLLARRHVRRAWLWFGLGGAAGLFLVFGPVLWQAREAFFFANRFHAARMGGDRFMLAVGSLLRLARGYLPLAGMAFAALAMKACAPPDSSRARSSNASEPVGPSFVAGPGLWLVLLLAIGTLQLAGPFPYDDYQVPLMPLAAAAVAVFFGRAVAGRELSPHAGRTGPLMAVVLLWCAVCAGASPLVEQWFVLRQDRFWVLTKPCPDIVTLRRTAATIRDRLPPDRPLLTQDLYLAVEAGRRVPPGFEMGPFGYFPRLDDRTAARFHVLNRQSLRRLLAESTAPMAAFSGYGLAIAAPAMTPVDEDERAELLSLVSSRYRLLRQVADFGQGHTALNLWVLE